MRLFYAGVSVGTGLWVAVLLNPVGVVLGLFAMDAALPILTAGLIPHATERAARALRLAPVWCLARGVGLLVTLPPLILSWVFDPSVIAQGLGLILLAGLTIITTLGAGGIVRLWSGKAASGLPDARALAKAGVIGAIARAFPIIGWLLLAPLMLVASVGAGASLLRPARRVSSG